MFDIGFTELMVIALVGLIVIGPERMPKLARTAGHLLGRLQRYVSDVKSDINREMQLEDLKKLQSQVAEQARDMEQQVNAQLKSVETSLNDSIVPNAESVATGETDATHTVATASADATAVPKTQPPTA